MSNPNGPHRYLLKTTSLCWALTVCLRPGNEKTQGKRAARESHVLSALQVADRIFVVSVQVCQSALAYHEPVTKKMSLKKKKIRVHSWSLSLYHEHESAVLNCTAREETGPDAGRAPRKTLHCLDECCCSMHFSHLWLPAEGPGKPVALKLLISVHLRFPYSFIKCWATAWAKNTSGSNLVCTFVFERNKN